jgi:hypothetical protein
MGLGFVLVIWAIIGVVAASIGALVYGSMTARLTRRVPLGRRLTILAAASLPFVCLGWTACVFVFQAVVNETVLHRDLGLGDTWHAPLPNGYQVMMIDVTDNGWVYNPRTQPESSVGEREDAVAGVRNLQVDGRYILGNADSKASERFGQETDGVDEYFLIDTQAGKRLDFRSYEELRRHASELHIELKLQPIEAVYSKYRFTWFDWLIAILFVSVPVGGTLMLVLVIRQLRKTRELVPS